MFDENEVRHEPEELMDDASEPETTEGQSISEEDVIGSIVVDRDFTPEPVTPEPAIPVGDIKIDGFPEPDYWYSQKELMPEYYQDPNVQSDIGSLNID